ncbi:phage tail assembly chaperone [Caldalkalibacillus mannanilyticus]|uniref:phage tail assembly chaperone n=1 Tax=Caldalkalibacillus mannanilyticus TaxID=1418 RepID=UPI000468DA64|nr:XkdN-like protein [Caldalkalibacillus mannanilyticus]
MNTLQEFLNANPVDNITEEVVISDRFKGNNGELFKFKIKAMSNEDFEQIRKKSTIVHTKGKRQVEVDVQKMNNDIIIQNTLEPSFKDAESIQKLGCVTPDEYLSKVLLPGEIAELSRRIQQLSGFDRDMDDLVEEAKN